MAELAAVMMIVSSVASVGATVVGGVAQQAMMESEAQNQANALTMAQFNAEAEKNQLQASNSINQSRQSEIDKRKLLDMKRLGPEHGYKPSVLSLIVEDMEDQRANANYQTQTRVSAIDTDIRNMGRQKKEVLRSGRVGGRLALLGAGAKAAGQVYGFSRDYVNRSDIDKRNSKYG